MADEKSMPLVPFSLEAEEAVIGSLLLESGYINDIVDMLVPKDFFHLAASEIYQSMILLKVSGKEINQVSVTHEIEVRTGKQDPIIAGYIIHLIATCPPPMQIKYHAEIVKRCSFYRELLVECGKMVGITMKQDPDIMVSLDKCESIIQDLRNKATTSSRVLLLGVPRLIETNPPRYIWNVNGKDLRLTLTEITIWGKFKNRIISELNFVPIRPKDWDKTINDLITHSAMIEAPVDASEEQQLKILILRWFERMREATVYSDLSAGRHIIKDVGGLSYYFFKSTPLLDYLKKEYKHGINSEDLWMSVHKWRGIKHKIRVKTPTGSLPVDLWGIPLSFAEEEAKTQVPNWF